MTKEELAKTVTSLIWSHNVVIRVEHDWGSEEVPYCFGCGYFGDKEDPTLHTANIVLEYLEEYYKERYS